MCTCVCVCVSVWRMYAYMFCVFLSVFVCICMCMYVQGHRKMKSCREPCTISDWPIDTVFVLVRLFY